MRVRITTVGALTWSLPAGRDVVEGETLTVQGALDALGAKHGEGLVRELMEEGRLRPGLALLLNGRNVLSLPEKFQTHLKEGDELIITIIVAGG